MSSFEEVKKELAAVAAAFEEEQENDIVKRTVAELIEIEKKSLYARTPGGRIRKIEDVINATINEYKESLDAS